MNPSLNLNLTLILLLLLIIFSWSWATKTTALAAHDHQDFLTCLTRELKDYSSISNIVYTRNNSSYTSILKSSIRNLRFASESKPKPQVIITPELESQIPPIIYCAKQTGLEIRTRSGGHDFEGLSYVSHVSFVVVDLINLSEIVVDVGEKTAWVGAGATISSLYYRIAEKSPVLGFPAGGCLTIGVGGHFSGGGYGFMMRKHGLSADNVIDARIIDVNGRILDRKSMGKDLFWAIRGGGGASFGIIVAWKWMFPNESLFSQWIGHWNESLFSQWIGHWNRTQLVHRWQYVAPKIDKDLFIGVFIYQMSSSQEGKNTTTIGATFLSLFLGGADKLLELMQESFPELGLVREDCTETSWIKSVVFIAGLPIQTPLQIMLNRTPSDIQNFKIKSSYVQKPIPLAAFHGLWRQLYEPEAKQGFLVMMPYGGRMDEISESATPFPHRAGNLYMFAHYVYWEENEARDSDRYISWSRRLYDYMTPYVSKSPRAAYLNYRDLDLGVNNVVGKTSYAEASIWGLKYFKNNFDRLVGLKTLVDPENFFRNEQSFPPLWTKKGD